MFRKKQKHYSILSKPKLRDTSSLKGGGGGVRDSPSPYSHSDGTEYHINMPSMVTMYCITCHYHTYAIVQVYTQNRLSLVSALAIFNIVCLEPQILCYGSGWF